MNNGIRKQIKEAIEAHSKLITALERSGAERIAAAAEAIVKTLKSGGRVYICGNGGSAADAQHIASELVGRFNRERRALPAVALTTDTSAITSISNDYGYDKVFARQAEALVEDGDIFWAISTSGGSANVIVAAATAKAKGACVLAFTGKSPSKLEESADICFSTESDSTPRTQEIHQLAYHIICDLVEQSFCQ